MHDGHTREKILIVDDIPINLSLLNEFLAQDYEIIQASHGRGALEKAATQKPDLILLDIMMPEMDGFEVCRQLKLNPATREIPVIFVTAKTDAEDISRGMSLGAVDYFAKPYLPAIMRARIRSHIERVHSQVIRAEEQARDLKAIQSRLAISALLETSLEPLPLDTQLTVALDIILTIPWLAVEYKGSIHLFNSDNQRLELVAHRNLAPHLLSACAALRLGECLCGQAADRREIVFKNQLDAEHTVTFTGIKPHGHYCTPILYQDQLLGVLNLYVAAGHQRLPEEDALLATLSNTLAGIIRHRRTEKALQEERCFIATILDTTSALVMLLDPRGHVIRHNAACEELTGLGSSEIEGKLFWSLAWTPADEQDRIQEIITLTAEDPTTLSFTGRWFNKKGREHHISWTLTFLTDANGGLKNFLATGIDVSERIRAEQRLERIAHHDALTGLPNRRLFMVFLQQTLARCRRHDQTMVVMFMDLDKFKAVNDTYGHDIGDLLLIESAQRIRNSLRENDVVARLGGDEFTIILGDEPLKPDIVDIVARKIITALRVPFQLRGVECRIGASIGVSRFPTDAESAEELLRKADLALYAVKKAGRNHHQMYHPRMESEGAG
ncbi:MAG: diguanylate cyclase [Magnetococcales bacterium]|nr:diguanylate cyclase [Magnetococcales bacterium]MBF0263060.1 diguanylate cyclase [Magnetococcales bacterium]